MSIASIFVFELKLGLDFTGGARWQIEFSGEEKVETSKLTEFFNSRKELTQGVQIQRSGGVDSAEFLITIEDLPDAELQEIAGGLKSEVGEFSEISYRKVDATIGQSFKIKSLYAVGTALIGIILFVAFAFRKIPASINPWRFGAVAIVALFHDILIIFGIFVALGYFFGIELNLPFITAILATLGFSVNDTIVVLDRVRENIHTSKGQKNFETIVEDSIQQTLFRSVGTSISTLFPLVALLIFGADAIFFFVLALTIGIVVGTYSSIFLAAPLLVSWKEWADERE